jgi:MFS family permease
MSPSGLLLAFMAVSITGGAAAGIMQLLIPLYAISLSVSQAGVGVIRGLAQFGGLLTSLPGGFLIDRYGARRVYTVACLLDGLTIILIPNFTKVPWLTAFLFLEGALGTLRWTTINSAFFSRLETFGHARAGWTRASLAVGANFIGPLIGGVLASSFSYHASYLVVGLIVAAPVCAIPLFRGRTAQVVATGQGDTESITDQFRGLITNRPLWRVALLQSTGISSNSAYLIYIVLLAVDSNGLSAATASCLLAAQGIAFVVSMFWGGRLVGRFSFRTLYSLAFGLQISGLLVTGCSSVFMLLIAGGVAFGLGSGMLTTISFSRLGSMAGQKGRLSGLFFLITGTGVALGPLWGGLLVTLWGIRAAFIGFVPVILIALVCVLLPRREISEFTVNSINQTV